MKQLEKEKIKEKVFPHTMLNCSVCLALWLKLQSLTFGADDELILKNHKAENTNKVFPLFINHIKQETAKQIFDDIEKFRNSDSFCWAIHNGEMKELKKKWLK